MAKMLLRRKYVKFKRRCQVMAGTLGRLFLFLIFSIVPSGTHFFVRPCLSLFFFYTILNLYKFLACLHLRLNSRSAVQFLILPFFPACKYLYAPTEYLCATSNYFKNCLLPNLTDCLLRNKSVQLEQFVCLDRIHGCICSLSYFGLGTISFCSFKPTKGRE